MLPATDLPLPSSCMCVSPRDGIGRKFQGVWEKPRSHGALSRRWVQATEGICASPREVSLLASPGQGTLAHLTHPFLPHEDAARGGGRSGRTDGALGKSGLEGRGSSHDGEHPGTLQWRPGPMQSAYSLMIAGLLQWVQFWPLMEKHQWRKEFSASGSISANALRGSRKESLLPEIFCWKSKWILNFRKNDTSAVLFLWNLSYKSSTGSSHLRSS